jgi:YVTN family beta-propeller protein
MLSIRTRVSLLVSAIGVTTIAGSDALAAPPSYTLFESGQVRPLALSPDKKTLFVVNTPDGRLEVYDVKSWGLKHRASVPVGIEPVAVAARSNTEVWVVNHVSDSVSVVHVGSNGHGRVTRTLLVGDEPRDIVFAGPGNDRAFITAAHRGQNRPADAESSTPGVGRADVWVFEAGALGASLGGTPMTIVTLFSDTPRALARSADGSRVYAAAHFSGNRTTTIDSAAANGSTPPPHETHAGVAAPNSALIVKYDGQHWVDELGSAWDDQVRFSLPDQDVFVIDAMAATPAQLGGSAGYFAGVGTTLFNMVVNPVSGKVYVSNTDARNDVRFSGPGDFADTTVRGHFVENMITVLDPAAQSVTPRHLNPHIGYGSCCASLPNDENELSLALPQGMAISADGETLYVAAMGSDQVGVYDTGALEAGMLWPDPAARIQVSGGGPTGVLLDESRDRLYVLTRFDNAISVVDTDSGGEVQHVAMYNPEPASITEGRRFLYDARLTSSHGDSACASCHVSGDMDHLAWDLGNPDGDMVTAPGPFRVVFPADAPTDFHPMKGPMTTQSLRGLANHGAMHWRGDRTGGNLEPSVQPDEGSFDEREAFRQFNEAFVQLQGRSEPIPAADMEAFADFALQMTYPPNPHRALDNVLTADEASGRELFMTKPATLGLACGFCHVLDLAGNAQHDVFRPGFFGTDGEYIGNEFPMTMKVPQLRNVYQKVGMFGMAEHFLINPDPVLGSAHTGDQVRGFGYTHEGSVDTITRFISQAGFIEDPVINPQGFPRDEAGMLERRQVEAFLLAFDSNMAPIVGQQITLRTTHAAVAGPRIDLLVARANAGECDLVAHGHKSGKLRGYLYIGGQFVRDEAGKPPISDGALRNQADHGGQEVTYTCMPPGSGVRAALDRDLDGVLDGDEHKGGD